MTVGDATKRTIHRTIHEYVLSTPTNGAEIAKALNWATTEMASEQAAWDDALTIEARDDELVIWWEERA